MQTRHLIRAVLALLVMVAVSRAELVTLSIQPQPFPSPSSVSVFVDAGLLGDDEVVSTLSGEITLDLQPSALNPTQARITSLLGVVDNEIDFQVGGGFLLPTVTVNADAGEVSVNIVAPGDAAEIVDDKFSQVSNLVGFDGVVTTSVQDDPIDLGMQEPTAADFNDVVIASDRTSLTLDAALLTTVVIPFEVGILELNVEIDIDGSVTATGNIPAAAYQMTTSAANATPYGSPENWRRGGVEGTGSLPISIDSVQFEGQADSMNQVDLGGISRDAQAITATSSVQLSAGSMTTNQVQVADGVVLEVDGTAQLALLDPTLGALEVSGGGELRMNGDAAASIALFDASLSGRGQVAAVTVGSQGRLVLVTGETLNIDTLLNFDAGAALRVTTLLDEVGSFTLAIANAIDSSLLDPSQTFINGLEYILEADQMSLHLESGVFGRLEVGPTQIQIITTQAIAGDTDGNGNVDFADFLGLSSAFGKAGEWIDGDFDLNGLIEFADFLALSSNFGKSTSPMAAVPEPSSHLCVLLGLAFMLPLFRRK